MAKNLKNPPKNNVKKLSSLKALGLLLNPGVIFLYVSLGLIFAICFPDKRTIDVPKGYTQGKSAYLRNTGLDSGVHGEENQNITKISLPVSSVPLSERKYEKSLDVDLMDATFESGIDFSHLQGGKMLSAITEVIGSGACVADYDRDGLIDIYTVSGTGFTHYYGKRWWWSNPPKSKLYHNKGRGVMEDAAKSAGTEKSGWGMGCAFGDYDNNGYPDLYVTNYGTNVLYRNNGDGTFTDVTDAAGVGDARWSTSVSWADYDMDGDLDLYVVNYVKFDKTMTPAEPNSAYKIVKPLLMNSALFDGERNTLYMNNGDGTFTDVTENSGVGNSPGRGLGSVFFDYDNDGDQDIYIANDKSRNILYRNNGDGTFTDVGGQLGVDSPLSGMGVTVGDYDNDGDMDIFSTYPQSETNILYRNSINKETGTHYNKKDGFEDITLDAGLGEDVSVGYFGWSTEFVDIDNDGFLDIFVANGHGMMDFDNPQTTIGQSNQIFMNNRDGTFTDVSARAGKALSVLKSSRGTAVGDFDNDGDVDFLVMNNNGESQFLQNENKTDNHWINVRLTGTKSNRDGIGAKVRLTSGGITQMREVRSGSGYLSQGDTRLAFGTGEYTIIEKISVSWPSGIVQRFHDVEVDRFIHIVEGSKSIEVDAINTGNDSTITKAVIDNKNIGEPDKEYKSVKKEGAVNKRYRQKRLDNSLRIEAISALGRIPDKKSFKILVALLEDKAPEIRKAAVKSLGKLGNADASRPLLLLLKKAEGDKELKREILTALGGLSTDKVINPLANALSAEDVEIRRDAALSLSRIFEAEERIFKSSMLKKREAVTALIKALDDPDALVRLYSLKSLGISESYRAVIPVTETFKDENPEVRREAVRAAGLIRDRRAIAPLLAVLNNPHEDVKIRTQAIFALKRLDSEILLQPIVKAASRGSIESRLNALNVMTVLLRDDESVIISKNEIYSFLDKDIRDKDLRIRLAALEIAGLLKGDGIDEMLIRSLRDKEIRVREEAARIGMELQQPIIIKELKKLVNDESKKVRKIAIESLSIGNVNVKDIELLKKVIREDKDQQIRLSAFSSLILVEEGVAIRLIKEEIKGDSPVKDELINLLGLTRSPEAIKLIIGTLGRDKNLDVQKSAVKSLGRFVEKKEVFSTILNVLKDNRSNTEVRKEALDILLEYAKKKRVGGKVFPFLTRILKDKNDPLRKEVIQCFAVMDEKKGALFLQNILKDRTETVDIRKTALSALVSIAPEQALEEIEKNLIL